VNTSDHNFQGACSLRMHTATHYKIPHTMHCKHCRALQHIRTYCTATHYYTLTLQHSHHIFQGAIQFSIHMRTAPHCNTLQHNVIHLLGMVLFIDKVLKSTCTHCNTLQHTTTHLPEMALLVNRATKYTATRDNTLQLTATRCNIPSRDGAACG